MNRVLVERQFQILIYTVHVFQYNISYIIHQSGQLDKHIKLTMFTWLHYGQWEK